MKFNTLLDTSIREGSLFAFSDLDECLLAKLLLECLLNKNAELEEVRGALEECDRVRIYIECPYYVNMKSTKEGLVFVTRRLNLTYSE